MVSILPLTSMLKSSFCMPGAANDTLKLSLFSVMFTAGTLKVLLMISPWSNHSFQGRKKSLNNEGIKSPLFINVLVDIYPPCFLKVYNIDLITKIPLAKPEIDDACHLNI